MNIGMRFALVLLPLLAACDRTGIGGSSTPEGSGVAPTTQPPGQTLRLESLYLNTSVRLTNDAPPARFVSMTLTRMSQGEMTGTLTLDPNTCSLDAFGERQACTRIAVRAIEVEVRPVSTVDPERAGRRIFEITGEGLPRELTMIVRGGLQGGRLERAYLKLGSELVPLYLDDGV